MFNPSFRLVNHPDWPPLGWLACLEAGNPIIETHIGPGIETGEQFIVEAAWDGEYEAGDFDLTDIVAGTGLRLRNDKLNIVSSGSTVDRLAVWRGRDRIVVANAVSAVFGFLGAAPVYSYRYYHRDLHSIKMGLQQYTRSIPSTLGPVELVYFNNLCWDGRALSHSPKPFADRRFPDFEHYYQFIDEGLGRIVSNARSPHRRYPWKLMTTISSGYDSPAVAALAEHHGCREAITFVDSRGGEDDSGAAIGEMLGLRVSQFKREDYLHDSKAESLFIAAEGEGEDVALASAAGMLNRVLLFTGHHAGRVWEKSKPNDHFTPDIVRRDVTGLSMTEYRLRAGFLHCPVPAWGIRNIDQIVQISDSPALAPWDVKSDYSRPLCRRIIENAGVPRDAFARSKKATAHTFFEKMNFVGERTLDSYQQWLDTRRSHWLKRGLLPPLKAMHVLLFHYYRVREQAMVSFMRTLACWPLAWRAQPAVTRLRAKVHRDACRPSLYQQTIFHWAIEQAARDFSGQLNNAAPAPTVNSAPRSAPEETKALPLS